MQLLTQVKFSFLCVRNTDYTSKIKPTLRCLVSVKKSDTIQGNSTNNLYDPNLI